MSRIIKKIEENSNYLVPIYQDSNLNKALYAVYFGEDINNVLKEYNLKLDQISDLKQKIKKSEKLLSAFKKVVDSKDIQISQNAEGLFQYAGSKAYKFNSKTGEYNFNLDAIKMISKHDGIDPYKGQIIIAFNRNDNALPLFLMSGDYNYPNREDLIKTTDPDTGEQYIEGEEWQKLENRAYQTGYRFLVYKDGKKIMQI